MSTDHGRSGFRSPRGRSIVLAVAALATLIGWLAATSLAAHARPVTPRSSAHRRVNQAPAVLQPTEVRVGHGFTNPSHPPTSSECEKVVRLACYSPLQLERAYDLRSLYAKGFTGRGRTIVIVDPFGSPTIRHDLKVFDNAFGLPAPPRFKVLAPVGRVPRYNPNNPSMTDKAGETTEDVEMAHALAPGANILLAETPKARDRRRRRVSSDDEGRGLRDQAQPRRRHQPELQPAGAESGPPVHCLAALQPTAMRTAIT